MDGPSRPKVKQCCQAVETPVALHEVHTHNTRGEREEMYKYETLTIKRPHRFLLLLPGPSNVLQGQEEEEEKKCYMRKPLAEDDSFYVPQHLAAVDPLKCVV